MFIAGTPRPQGSKKAYNRNGKIVLVESATGLKEWRDQIRLEYQAANLAKYERPMAVVVDLMFCLPQIKRPVHRFPTVKPDIDKLARAVLDALTGVAYDDDSQVTQLTLQKVYTWTDPGVYITVTAINNDLITTRKR